MDTIELMETMLEACPTCRVCEGAADTVRDSSNPKWGLDPDGKPRTEIGEWLAGVNPMDVVGVCWEHLDVARKPGGGWIHPKGKQTKSGNWMKDRQTEKRDARVELIQALGEQCATCGQQAPAEEMRVIVPDQSRHQYGISSRAEWWRFIVAHPRILEMAHLLCVGCGPATRVQRPDRLNRRERVVRAYGGVCWRPGCNRSEDLMIAARPETPTLRWPNGEKYNSAAKVAWLVRNGFPPGWTLTCGPHQNELQRGGGIS
jgi:hypothetical protein